VTAETIMVQLSSLVRPCGLAATFPVSPRNCSDGRSGGPRAPITTGPLCHADAETKRRFDLCGKIDTHLVDVAPNRLGRCKRLTGGNCGLGADAEHAIMPSPGVIMRSRLSTRSSRNPASGRATD